jgi:phosphatidylinositol phospholipase C delta
MSGYNSAFSEYITPPPSSHNPAVSTTRTSNICQDMTLPLSSYFICCSHNTYLVGNQLVGTSSVEGYVRALLDGCRSVEMDIYDGPEPGLTKNLAMTMSNTISTDVGEITEEVEEAVGVAAEVVESAGLLGSTANDGLTPEHRGVTATYKGIIPGEPIVTHGGTLTSSLSARRICEAIERYAFVTSPYPVIISGELHCSM